MANAEENIDYDLLGRVFQGECSEAEKAETEAWIQASEENRLTWEALKEVWELSPDLEAQEKVNTDAAWSKVAAKTGIASTPASDDVPYLQRQPRKNPTTRYLLYAASFILACLAGWFVATNNSGEIDPEGTRMVVMQTGAEGKTIQLPDGSTVNLNANSNLSFPEVFAEGQRQVILEGEAFFDVSHDPEKPFVIEAGATEVKVLGTRFSINSQEEKVEVAVESGKVSFQAKGAAAAAGVILTQAEKASFQPDQQSIQKEGEVSPDEFYWMDKKLNFRNTPMQEVEEILERVYGIDLLLENEILKDCKLNVAFENDQIAQVLKVIAGTLKIEYREEGETQILSGNACP